MGSFFTNVQVFAGKEQPEEVQAWAVGEIRKLLREQGYEPVKAGEQGDRTVVVGPAGPEPWISVFDEATEDQNIIALDSLAGALSAGGRVAVGILVHDSDVLILRLFRNGALEDYYNNFPEYFDEVTPEEVEACQGRPEKWRDLLQEGKEEDLDELFGEDPDFAEDLLDELAVLFGWNPETCSVGYNYLGDFDLEGLINLVFRKK